LDHVFQLESPYAMKLPLPFVSLPCAAVLSAACLSHHAFAQSSPIWAGNTLTVVETDPSNYTFPGRSATIVNGGPAEFAFSQSPTYAFYVNPDNGVLKLDWFGLIGAGGSTNTWRWDFILPSTLKWDSLIETSDSFGALNNGGPGQGWMVAALNPATPQVATLTIEGFTWNSTTAASATFSVLTSPVAAVPEPSAAILGSLGLATLAGFVRSRKRKAAQ
jgi:PEP-CTERM motif